MPYADISIVFARVLQMWLPLDITFAFAFPDTTPLTKEVILIRCGNLLRFFTLMRRRGDCGYVFFV